MVFLAVVLALFGALANTIATLMQKHSAGTPESSELFGRKFFGSMLLSKFWLGGIGLDFIGSLFQAGALYFGSLVLVEPLLTVDLVMLFLILHYYFRSKTNMSGWLGAVLMLMGLTAFLLASSPTGGRRVGDLAQFAWVIGVLGAYVIIAGLIMRASTLGARPRIVIGALATGLNFSLTSVFTKLAMTDLSHGLVCMLTSWAFWALVISAVSAVIIMQATYASGSLKISQPIITIVGPLASVLLSVELLGTHVRLNPLALAVESLGALGIIAGILMLTSSRPVVKLETTNSMRLTS